MFQRRNDEWVALLSAKALMRWVLASAIHAMLAACATPSERAIHSAMGSGMNVTIIDGTIYRHDSYYRDGKPGSKLLVFIEGDGSPWTDFGRTIATDPTPRHPLALQLAQETPGAVLYLGRPCYFRVRDDVGCAASVWTSDRYSAQVVGSMAAAVNRFASAHGYPDVMLIGYSGGGTLGLLMAPRIPATSMVVTIAANMDVAAWTQYHRYLPLTGSMNPASEPPLSPSIRQLHLFGARDANVSERVNRRFLDTLTDEQIWRFPSFGHVCCWVRDWSAIWTRIEAKPPE